MSVIDYNSPLRALVSVKGHPYNRDEFFEIFEAMGGVSYTAVEQPASQVFYDPEVCDDYDALVFYDMPGIDFSSQPPTLVEPPASAKKHFHDLLESGKGMVFLHHAVAGWPLWPEYGQAVGGRFWYLPMDSAGEIQPDGGYRHEVSHQVSVLADHPVTEGVAAQFPIVDELYLYDVNEEDVIPLLRSDYDFVAENFYSATEAVSGRMHSRENWARTSGSALLGWARRYRNSPIVYLQMGDGPTAYNNPEYRKLIENAIRWVSSDAAHDWAQQG